MAQDSFGTGETEKDLEFTDISSLSYEQARDELREVVDLLEQGNMPLEDSLKYWERGEDLAQYCEQYLDGAREKIQDTIATRENSEQSEDS